MALQATITTNQGITVSSAYCRVADVSLSKDTMSFSLWLYADKEKAPFEKKTFTSAYDLNGSNPIKQAYEHLKTLPEFAGATDV